MDRIDIRKAGQDNHEFWFAITAITLKDSISGVAAIDKIHAAPDGFMEVCLTVNGVEVSYIDTVRDWASRMDAYVSERAAELIKSTVLDSPTEALRSLAYEFEERLRDIKSDMIRDLEKKLGVSIRQSDD